MKISTSFLNHSASVIGATREGLSGSKIVKICNAWAVDYDVDPPHSVYPFDAQNKRTALFENLAAFDPEIQYELILDLCDNFGSEEPADVTLLREKLISKYGETERTESPSASPPVPADPSNQNISNGLRVFLCHASGDKPRVRNLHRRLLNDGYQPWLDEIDLLPGQDWQIEIPNAVRESHVVLVCLSQKSVTKEGYVQKEIKFALDVADEKPEGVIFIIPTRFEKCDSPRRLAHLHRVDLFQETGYQKLAAALENRRATVK